MEVFVRRIIPLLLIPLALFSYSFKDAMAYKNMDPQKLDAAEALLIELGMPTYAETKQELQDEVAKWLADEQNQAKIMQKLRDCAKQGGLENSPEIIDVMQQLEDALKQWNKVYHSAQVTSSQPTSITKTKINISMLAMHGRYYEDEINEDNAARQIQSLREEEQEHKDQARELFIQAGGEAAAAGVTFMTGAELIALYEEVQSVRHLVKSCGEYMEGVECQREADALERQYFPSEEEQKSWWQIWK